SDQYKELRRIDNDIGRYYGSCKHWIRQVPEQEQVVAKLIEEGTRIKQDSGIPMPWRSCNSTYKDAWLKADTALRNLEDRIISAKKVLDDFKDDGFKAMSGLVKSLRELEELGGGSIFTERK
ncbi:hypothetical protein BGX28_000575, partial [Mortierella sp. GBA30]